MESSQPSCSRPKRNSKPSNKAIHFQEELQKKERKKRERAAAKKKEDDAAGADAASADRKKKRCNSQENNQNERVASSSSANNTPSPSSSNTTASTKSATSTKPIPAPSITPAIWNTFTIETKSAIAQSFNHSIDSFENEVLQLDVSDHDQVEDEATLPPNEAETCSDAAIAVALSEEEIAQKEAPLSTSDEAIAVASSEDEDTAMAEAMVEAMALSEMMETVQDETPPSLFCQPCENIADSGNQINSTSKNSGGSQSNNGSGMDPGIIQSEKDSSKSTSPSDGSAVPKGKTGSAYRAFLALPETSEHCSKVDTKGGLWYWCTLCGKEVPNREDRLFTVGRWNEHERKNTVHLKKEHHLNELKNNQMLTKDGKKLTKSQIAKMSDSEILELYSMDGKKMTKLGVRKFRQVARSQVPLQQFFAEKKSKDKKGNGKTTAKSTGVVDKQASNRKSPPEVSDVVVVSRVTMKLNPGSCEGVLPDFRDRDFKVCMRLYCLYAAVSVTAAYTVGYVGRRHEPQFFSKSCTQKKGTLRKTKKGNIYACDGCNKLREIYSTKMRQTVNKRAKKFKRAEEFTKKSEITPEEMNEMEDFVKANDDSLSIEGKAFKRRILTAVNFYRDLAASEEAKVVANASGYVPGVDSFLDRFIHHYMKNPEFRQHLIVDLAKSYVLKVDGLTNPQYGTKVLNFYMAIAASGDAKAFEYISGNLCGVSLRWMKTLMSRKRSDMFIDLDKAQMVERMLGQFHKIRSKFGNGSLRITFTVGNDATCLVSSYQICATHGAIVGGASPNHSISIAEIDNEEEVKKILQECTEGKRGEQAAEIKCAVISFQNAPPGMCPYFVLAGRPQTINENNDFGDTVMDACVIAAKKAGNAAVVNESTDGVSCECEWNQAVMMKYLEGKCNYTSLPDPNHNIKNLRGQLITGSSASPLGHYIFDPWLLKAAGVAKEVIRPSDYASDALPMRMASADTIKKILSCSFPDVGNVAVTTVSLAFMRLRSYAVNAKKVNWRERAIYTWSTLLWFTSFQAPFTTMGANKRNMLLESVGLLFLVTRMDVSQPRRLTSECNEHTYGFWRMLLREFNMEQLIRIAEKANIRLEALFESNLVTSRSKTYFRGYQQTFPEYIESLKSGASGLCGPVDVDLDSPAVNQLWDEVKGVMETARSWMLPFLKEFGVEPGNGLSPFATNIDSPAELSAMIDDFFKPPKRDPRGRKSLVNSGNAAVEASVGDSADVDLMIDEDESLVMEDEELETIPAETDAMGVDIISAHVTEIKQSESASGDEVVTVLEELEDDTSDVEHFFDAGASSESYDIFRVLIRSRNMDEMSECAFKLVQLLQLGKLEKGAISSSSKYQSRNGRWFSQKARAASADGDRQCDAADSEGDELYIKRDSLVHLSCTRGKSTSTESYRVLAFFSKYYNKWFVADEEKFVWDDSNSSSAKVRVLARMMKKSGSVYTEETLEADGDWNAMQIYRVVPFSDILKLENELVDV